MKQDAPGPRGIRRPSQRGIVTKYREFTAVRADGLPPVRVIVAFTVLLALIGILLVAFAINGTSSGAFYGAVHDGKDPSLLAGAPEQIRSDEWGVGAPLTISQVQQDLPSVSRSFPGGVDVDLPFGLPDRAAATIMEPQNWGFLFLDANHAYAWKWWVPALALVAASFALMVSLIPRRPLVAAGLSIGFFFSPFFQWWFETTSQWPIVWGGVTMTAIMWMLRSNSVKMRVALVVLVAYFTTVMAVGVYAPFIIPVVYVVLFFGIGRVILAKREGATWRQLALRLAPIAGAGVVGGGAILLWLHSKSTVVAGFLGTVYPGQRLTPTGTLDVLAFARTLGATFSESLKNTAGFLGVNSSESSSFFLLGAFLLPLSVWVVVRRRKKRAILPWTTIGLAAFLALVLAFIFIPGWNVLAHLLFLDLTNGTRMRIGVGLASFALIGSVVRDLDDEEVRVPRPVAWLVVAAFAAVQFALAFAIYLVLGAGRLWGGSPLWLLYAAISAAAIYLVARRRAVWATAAFLVVSVASSIAVNPVYVGVLDLRDTAVSREIVKLDAASSKSWVGVGGLLDGAILLESGVTAYNGTQAAPSKVMWKQIDPAGRYSNQWNRLAAVDWVPGHGAPVVTNPAADVIRVTFDACSTFAQKNVGYVLSNVPLTSPCLDRTASFALSHGKTIAIYDVKRRNQHRSEK